MKSEIIPILNNPQVAKALSNVYVEHKFNDYEKNGLLDECEKQRTERLENDTDVDLFADTIVFKIVALILTTVLAVIVARHLAQE